MLKLELVKLLQSRVYYLGKQDIKKKVKQNKRCGLEEKICINIGGRKKIEINKTTLGTEKEI